MLLDQLNKDLIVAMKAHEAEKVSTVRLLISALKNEKIAKMKDLTPDDEVTILMRQAKQRKDSIEQFEKGDRQEMADKERAELLIIEAYLPSQMSKEEILEVVKAKKAALGVTDKSQVGKLMGALMAELKGKADGGLVKLAVEESFA